MTQKRAGHALHKALIARSRAANSWLREGGFWSALVRILIAESGADHGSERKGLTRAAFEVDLVQGVREELARDSDGARMPDAWAFDDASMTVVLWEACNFQRPESANEKWDGLTLALDGHDEWTVKVVTVDSRGICHLSSGMPGGPRVWLVDEPAPPLFDVAMWTKRSRSGGVDAAFAAAVDEAYRNYVEWFAANEAVSA